MEHLDCFPDQFRKILDPYNHGRICYEFLHLTPRDIACISRDERFLIIAGTIIYFSKD